MYWCIHGCYMENNDDMSGMERWLRTQTKEQLIEIILTVRRRTKDLWS